MDSLETLTTFLGLSIVVNIGVVLIGVLFFGFFHEWIGAISAKIFGITKEEAKATFFRVFQQYRFAIAFLNLVPYIVLKIMAA